LINIFGVIGILYDVNVQQIEEQLQYVDEICEVLQDSQIEKQKERLLLFQLSRAIHLGAECVIEVGTLLIDGFIMRDPGSYLDIIDILEDEQVVDSALAEELRAWIRLRERVVRQYVHVTLNECLPYQHKVNVLQQFQAKVRSYLQHQL
jgi:uncharacterized protein YutE (UPF0331/DUF86 family)